MVQMLKLLLIYYLKIYKNFMTFFFYLPQIKPINLSLKFGKISAKFLILKLFIYNILFKNK